MSACTVFFSENLKNPSLLNACAFASFSCSNRLISDLYEQYARLHASRIPKPELIHKLGKGYHMGEFRNKGQPAVAFGTH